MNRSPSRSLHVGACLAILFFGIHPAAADGAEDFSVVAEKARRMAMNRSTTSADRVAMVDELAGFSTAAAASHIVSIGLSASAPEPQSAARKTLAGLSADKRVRAALIASFKKEAGRGSPLAPELAIVLLAAEKDHDAGEFRLLLDRMPPPAILAVCDAVCAAAIRLGDETAVAALASYARTQSFAGSLACRRAVVSALAQIPDLAAVEALIAMLGTIRGEARGDIMTIFGRVSGKGYSADQGELKAWLDAHREELGKLPLASDEHPVLLDEEDEEPDEKHAAYYDIPIYADRAVFVIDVSGSMEGEPLVAAKRELTSAIFGLPETSFFSVLAFHSNVGAWQRQLVQANDLNKRAAADFVARLKVGGGTATSDALRAAFEFDTEAIFFMSDGEPSTGKIIDPAAIVTMVSQLNASRGVSVNAISIMGGAEFLEELARTNRGSFRAIDN